MKPVPKHHLLACTFAFHSKRQVGTSSISLKSFHTLRVNRQPGKADAQPGFI